MEIEIGQLERQAATDVGLDSDASLTRLTWFGIIAPLAFVTLLHLLIHTVLYELHRFPWVILLFGIVAIGITVFSFGIFALVRRLEGRIRERTHELSTLLTVGRATSSSLELGSILDHALHAVLDVAGAESAELWLQEHGKLALARRRGQAPARAATPSDHERREAATYALPLVHRGETLGVLAISWRGRNAPRNASEQRLLEGIGERIAVAIDNSRLHARVLDGAVLEERERIARELHDGLAQVLGYINTQTLAIRKLVASGRTEEAERELLTMEHAARQVYADVREAILGLRGPFDGLVPSLQQYLDVFRPMAGCRLALDVSDAAGPLELPVSTEIQLVRIVQEALSNVRKHAQADSATVRLHAEGGELRVEVVDDGRGFERDRIEPTGWPHFGLQTMKERALSIGGTFEIRSTPGTGSTVRVRLPLAPVGLAS